MLENDPATLFAVPEVIEPELAEILADPEEPSDEPLARELYTPELPKPEEAVPVETPDTFPEDPKVLETPEILPLEYVENKLKPLPSELELAKPPENDPERLLLLAEPLV